MIKEAIRNLETISDALNNAANNPKNYNTDFAYYLEQMSWEMAKQAKDLSVISELMEF